MKLIQPLGIFGYEFSDLRPEAREKVINDTIAFWIETREYDAKNPRNFEKAIDESNRMHTPWFVGSYIYDYCKQELEEELEANDYIYDEGGEIFPLYHHGSNKVTLSISKHMEIPVTIEELLR